MNEIDEMRVGVTPGDIVRTTLGLTRRVGSIVALVCGAGAVLCAQPDPRQMSGIPRPDPNLADGLITVRVIRGNFTNNVPDHTVELLAGDAVSTADTDPEGRASFTSLAPGSEVRVATTLDGERLVSQPFATPGRGGVAVLLVGTMGGSGDPAVSIVVNRDGYCTNGSDGLAQPVPWEEVFMRESDRFWIRGTLEEIDLSAPSDFVADPGSEVELLISEDTVRCGESTVQLETVASLRVRATSWTEPREAMGFGDRRTPRPSARADWLSPATSPLPCDTFDTGGPRACARPVSKSGKDPRVEGTKWA